MKATDIRSLDQIKRIRISNNSLWMSLLYLALETSPEKAKGIMKEIAKNDTKITTLTRKLSK